MWCKPYGVCWQAWGHSGGTWFASFLSCLLFMTRYHHVSGVDFLSLLMFVRPKDVCFPLKYIFLSQECHTIFSLPTPKIIHFLFCQSATKLGSVHLGSGKLHVYKFQCNGIEVREEDRGRMWHWKLEKEIRNCHLLSVRNVNPVEMFCWHSENTVKIFFPNQSHLCYSKTRTENRSFG